MGTAFLFGKTHIYFVCIPKGFHLAIQSADLYPYLHVLNKFNNNNKNKKKKKKREKEKK
jgi:hypothetical protein